MKNKIIIAALIAALIPAVASADKKRSNRAAKRTAGRLVPFSTDLLESNQQNYYSNLDDAGKQIYQQAFDDGRARIKKLYAGMIKLTPQQRSRTGYKGTTGRLIPFDTDLLESHQQTYYTGLDAAGKKIYQQGFNDGRERIIKGK
jgi:hypothetical protein